MSFITRNIKAFQKQFKKPEARRVGAAPSRAAVAQTAKAKAAARRARRTPTILSTLGEPGASQAVERKTLLGG